MPPRGFLWLCCTLGKEEFAPDDTGAVCMDGNLTLGLSLPKKETWAVMRACKGKPSYSPQSCFPPPCLVAGGFLPVVSFSFPVQFSFCRTVAFNDFL